MRASGSTARRPDCSASSPKPRRRWADACAASDDDSLGGWLPRPAPTVDDSYREGPASCLEDSKASLNLKFGASAELQPAQQEQASTELKPAPKDFAFLFRGCESSVEVAGASAVPPTEDSEPRWKPNLEAPEFIPTLTMQCPLVGFSSGNPEADVTGPAKDHSARDHDAASKSAQDCRTPDERTAAKTRQEPASGPSKRICGSKKRRRPATVQAQQASDKSFSTKRQKSEEPERGGPPGPIFGQQGFGQATIAGSPFGPFGPSVVPQRQAAKNPFGQFGQHSAMPSPGQFGQLPPSIPEVAESDCQHSVETR